MPAMLSRFLPHIIGALAVIGAIWFIYDKGRNEEALANEARATKAERGWNERIDRLETSMTASIAKIDGQVAERISSIDTVERTVIKPTLEREIVRETRFSDSSLGLSVGLLNAINAARAETACSTRADGAVECILSAAKPSR